MSPEQFQAEQFEASRPHLQAIAYRMLGSASDAEDAVQEAWLRVNRADTAAVDNMRGWLTTIVSRICLDMLRTRRTRPEEPIGEWDQAPIVSPIGGAADNADPEQELLLADSVALALLVVLETLNPAERLAFVLHDMFGVPFEEIAPIVEREVPATRQLASRARRRVRGAEPEARAADVTAQRRIVDAFLAASREGDFDALMAVLDPDVEFKADRALADNRPLEVTGAANVAPLLLERGSPFARFARPAIVDGRAGFVVVAGERVLAVLAFDVDLETERVTRLRLTRDPDKLAAVRV
jgi:RNA polymerase sigma factor (sigma-70 family)